MEERSVELMIVFFDWPSQIDTDIHRRNFFLREKCQEKIECRILFKAFVFNKKRKK
jgi:hypothetical protein